MILIEFELARRWVLARCVRFSIRVSEIVFLHLHSISPTLGIYRMSCPTVGHLQNYYEKRKDCLTNGIDGVIKQMKLPK